MSERYDFLDEALEERKNRQQFRKLKSILPSPDAVNIVMSGRSYINFSSNDYLGLAGHPQVISRARQYAEQYGAGSTASRLISGTYEIHTKLEEKLAATFGREAAVVFNSGFQANSSILGTVTDRHSLILADKLSHNSLLQGSLFSRSAFQRFNHNDMHHLERLLKKAENGDYNRVWIVTESVFSMDGDRCPLDEIAALADTYNALLFVDDAHAVGVWGDSGLGFGKGNSRIDILLGTCGKSFGSFGAYVVCSQKMRDYLINFCPGFIYTTALPPAVIGATDAALELIPTLDTERSSFHKRIEGFRKSVQKLGFETGASSTQIIPIIIGDEKDTLQLAEYLEERGILATAIRPPTVPERSSRIRITLSLNHTKEHVDKLLSLLKKWSDE